MLKHLMTNTVVCKSETPKYSMTDFIIIEEKQIYTLGASVKDMGKKIFMFSAINEKWIKEAILAKYNECWNKENTAN